MKFDIDARAGSPPTTVPQARPASSLKNPQRLAWLVIWGAFFVCITATVSLPLGARRFILYSVEARPGTLQAINVTQEACGTVRFTPPNAAQPTAVTCDPASFPEGSTIATDLNSRALITFFEGSIAQVFPGTLLIARGMRQPRFQWSELANTVQVDQQNGLVLYAVAPALVSAGNPQARPVAMEVRTPGFDAVLSEGSYSIEVDEKGTQIVVRSGGPASVHANVGTREAIVSQGQRLFADAGKSLSEPLPAAQDLIANGGFTSDLFPPAWQPFFDQGGDGGTVDGKLNIVTVDGRRSLHISREGSGSNSAISGLRQTLNRDVSYFQSLVLYADVRLHNQALSGGGYQSTEYPLILRLKYRDVNGDEYDYVQGFYYQNTDNNPTKNGEPIPVDKWVPYQTGNLLQMLDPKPFYLLSVEIYASGWDYESYISTLRLTVE
ncbi:MAG: hypothetical protein ACM3JD_13405 [Rudaea sp.]